MSRVVNSSLFVGAEYHKMKNNRSQAALTLDCDFY